MPNITLSLPEDLHRRMKRHSEIRWSEVVRRILAEKIRDLELMEQMTSTSLLSDEDVDALDHLLKEAILKRYREKDIESVSRGA